MTEEQHKKYVEVKKEIEPLKDFLFWCGDKYRSKGLGQYPFKIIGKITKFVLKITLYWVSDESCIYEIPVELRNRIIETIEAYVEQKEEEIKNI